MSNNTSYVIDLAARYAAVFGAMSLSDNAQRNAVLAKENNEYSIELYPEYDHEVENIKFEWEDKSLNFNSIFMMEGEAFFAPPPIISFSREKNLVTTEISGSDNVVVERWGNRPWEMNIVMLLIDITNRQYPSERIRQIHKLFEYNGVVKVEGVQFEEKDIDSVYFDSINIRPVDGFSDTMQVVLNAKSIKEVFYNLLKPNS